jgi:hypothetical protein
MTNHERIKLAFAGLKAPESVKNNVLRDIDKTAVVIPGRIYHKRRLAVMSIVIILALLITSTALAYTQILDFSRIYRIVFGENSEYIEQYIEPLFSENTSATDKSEPQTVDKSQKVNEPQPVKTTIESEYDGIVISLISAIN